MTPHLKVNVCDKSLFRQEVTFGNSGRSTMSSAQMDYWTQTTLV
jgi:hypothetical protein